MKRIAINATQPEEVRVAMVDGQYLYDLDIEYPFRAQKKSNIYKGTITRVEPSLEAAFVNYGADRHGFLPFKEISREYWDTKGKKITGRPSIREVIKEGLEVLVQVDKEERGNKGAALTTQISLAGRYLVLMPNNPRAGGVSRRIEGEDRHKIRKILQQLDIPEGMGTIVRTAGVGRELEELTWDLDYLLTLWKAITSANEQNKAPVLLYQESNVIIRTLRDYFRKDVGEILVDNERVYKQAHDFIQAVMPHNLHKLKHYTDSVPLFSRYQVEHQIESAFHREVTLPSGGAIVIDHTEALISIDVNSARSTKGAGIEETALNTNLEAADEVARQLRLRDLGGLVVIDFIDMLPNRNQREVERRLREALKVDRARVQVGRISRFGLLEMSRQRLRPSLGEASQIVCPRCSGQGSIRGVESLALSIMRLMEEEAMKDATHEVIAQTPIHVASFLLNEKRKTLAEIQSRHNIKLTVLPNHHLDTPHYEIQRIKNDEVDGDDVCSYKQINKPVEENDRVKQVATNQLPAEAAVGNVTPSTPSPTPQGTDSKSTVGLLNRIFGGLFGSKKVPEKPSKEEIKEDSEKKQKPANNRNQNNRNNNQQQRRSNGRQNTQRRNNNRQNNKSNSNNNQQRQQSSNQQQNNNTHQQNNKQKSNTTNKQQPQNKQQENRKQQNRQNPQNKPQHQQRLANASDTANKKQNDQANKQTAIHKNIDKQVNRTQKQPASIQNKAIDSQMKKSAEGKQAETAFVIKIPTAKNNPVVDKKISSQNNDYYDQTPLEIIIPSASKPKKEPASKKKGVTKKLAAEKLIEIKIPTLKSTESESKSKKASDVIKNKSQISESEDKGIGETADAEKAKVSKATTKRKATTVTTTTRRKTAEEVKFVNVKAEKTSETDTVKKVEAEVKEKSIAPKKVPKKRKTTTARTRRTTRSSKVSTEKKTEATVTPIAESPVVKNAASSFTTKKMISTKKDSPAITDNDAKPEVVNSVKEDQEALSVEKKATVKKLKPKTKTVSKTTRQKVKKETASKSIVTDVKENISQPTKETNQPSKPAKKVKEEAKIVEKIKAVKIEIAKESKVTPKIKVRETAVVKESSKPAKKVKVIETEVVKESTKPAKKANTIETKIVEESTKPVKKAKVVKTERVEEPLKPVKTSKVIEKKAVEKIPQPRKKIEIIEVEKEVKQPSKSIKKDNVAKVKKKAVVEKSSKSPKEEIKEVEELPKVAKKSKPAIKKEVKKSSDSEPKKEDEIEVKKESQDVINTEDVISKEKDVTNDEV